MSLKPQEMKIWEKKSHKSTQWLSERRRIRESKMKTLLPRTKMQLNKITNQLNKKKRKLKPKRLRKRPRSQLRTKLKKKNLMTPLTTGIK